MRVNGCGPVSFAGHVDRSVYQYANEQKRLAKKCECIEAERYDKPKPKEQLKEIEERTDAIMSELEQKAKMMNKNVHFAVIHEGYDDSNYLVMYNKKDKSIFKPMEEYALLPASKSAEQYTSNARFWKLDNLAHWQKRDLNLDSYDPKDRLEILERRIDDIDVEKSDKWATDKNSPDYMIIGNSKYYKRHFPYLEY